MNSASPVWRRRKHSLEPKWATHSTRTNENRRGQLCLRIGLQCQWRRCLEIGLKKARHSKDRRESGNRQLLPGSTDYHRPNLCPIRTVKSVQYSARHRIILLRHSNICANITAQKPPVDLTCKVCRIDIFPCFPLWIPWIPSLWRFAASGACFARKWSPAPIVAWQGASHGQNSNGHGDTLCVSVLRIGISLQQLGILAFRSSRLRRRYFKYLQICWSKLFATVKMWGLTTVWSGQLNFL